MSEKKMKGIRAIGKKLGVGGNYFKNSYKTMDKFHRAQVGTIKKLRGLTK